MKKMMSMAAMLALMLVAAAPAFADTTEGGDVEFEGSDQTQTAFVWQYTGGMGLGGGGDAQSVEVEQNQASYSFGF